MTGINKMTHNCFVVALLCECAAFSAYSQHHPVALRDDITISDYISVGPNAVRILLDPVTKDIFYTTFEGGIVRVRHDFAGNKYLEEEYTAADHSITRLQGAVFLDSTLYLVGNISVNRGKGTKGIMMKGQLNKSGKRDWSLVFITEDVGSTKTIYDHGFNGIVISPDKKYFYINSGARTDHGEVQDNDGEYPNSRDEPLTACVLRIPVNSEALYLPDDRDFLVRNGFLFADGIRNAFDLAWSPDGKLFAVSNSSDYDHPEDMFWLREGRHYGFPWVMGNLDNPQQYKDWHPDPKTDPFINPFCHAWNVRYFRNDPDFPKRPKQKFTAPVLNLGPDANEYRDRKTGKVMDADTTGVRVGTFTPHRSPLGLFFDTEGVLIDSLNKDGFVLSWTFGKRSSLMRPFSSLGADMMHLDLRYDAKSDNYLVRTTRIVEGFDGPTDAILIGNDVYVIENGTEDVHIWKVTLPAKKTTNQSSKL
jgi:hypothetical protein